LPERIAMILFLLAAAVFLFADERTTPIILWDESRNVMNALEMRRSGLSLVTTYGFEPDLWNTKPPLLIWLMYGSMELFGASEWALRLPSALAGLATILIVVSFVRRVSASFRTGSAAGVLLLLSPGFFSEHGARTADYDALLLFFTTAYLQLLFFAVHKRRPGVLLSLLIGALLACALLTKSSAALIPAAGVPLYLIAVRRWRRPLAALPRYAILGCAAIVPFAAFCLAREAIAPGYIEAVLYNDLVGRFQQTLIGRETSPWFYLHGLSVGWFLAGPLLVTAPFALGVLRGRKRALLLYALLIAGAQIVICSLSATRLVHYMLPAFPWLAAAGALGGAALWKRYAAPALGGARTAASPALAGVALCLLLLANVAVRSVQWRYHEMSQTQFIPDALYGELFASLARQGYSEATVSDPGFDLVGDKDPNYAPRLDAYRMMWAERGLAVRRRTGFPVISDAAVVASCNPSIVQGLLAGGRDIGGIAGCAAVSPAAHKRQS
jgi:4-amino-4-deoxy-L-arabinose transferase-like glycosyltransferase